MNKVICDVCGTTYPETADQCPICGCAKPEEARPISPDASADAGSVNTYTYVKGGRFSKSNVRKRTRLAAAAQKDAARDPDMQEPEQSSSNTGLIIAIIMLALAIVAVIGYILVNFFGWGSSEKPTEPAITTTAATTTQQTTTEETFVVCTDLTLAVDTIELTEVDEAWLINAIPTPEDTTDLMTYVSSDPSVATVSDEGRVTAVGTGEAVITVTCGDVSVECTVICNIETEPPTAATTEAPTEPTTAPVVDGNWSLNRKDFTLSDKGDTWELYKGDVSKNLITFSSDDETVATFENGVVTAVGPGHTTVRAEYGDKKLSCMVHCSFKDDATEPTEEETTAPAPSGTYSVYIDGTDVANRRYGNEVTLAPGKTFRLTLVDTETEKAVDVDWKTGDAEVCTVEGSTVTGVAKGNTKITVTLDGKTYECIIHVTG